MTLVLHLPFREGKGTTVHDQSENDNHGTIYGASWLRSKRFRGFPKALSFNGSTDYVEIADSPSVSLSDALTVLVWVYPLSNIPMTKVIAKWGLDNMCYFVGNNDGKLYGYIKANETHYSVDGVTPVPLEQWSHLTMTWDGAKLRSYLNGVFKKDKDTVGTILDTPYPLCIGAQKGSKQAEGFFNSVIDEVRIYNRALSVDEILACYMQRKRKDYEMFL